MEPEPTKSEISISLSAYRWHQLLRELEDAMRIVNRDNDALIGLYENIGSQLSGGPVVVERRKQPPVRPMESVSEERKPDSSFWSKFKK
jgi:hypothetical protein